MMNTIRQWYLRNHTEITWFLIGFLIMAGLVDISQGDWTGTIINFGLAWVNYIFRKQ